MVLYVLDVNVENLSLDDLGPLRESPCERPTGIFDG